MQISLRSYLTVGTAAVVGAGAIALTPVLPGGAVNAAYLPAPVTAEINLTGLNLSFTDILGVLDKFGVVDIANLMPIINLLPTNLIDAVTAQFLDDALPLVKQTAGDVFKYVAGAASQLFLGKDSIPNQILGALVNVPAVVGAAVGELKNGDPGAALQALTAGFAAPITVIGQVLKQAIADFTTFMETTLGSVAGQLGTVLVSAVTAVVGDQLGGGLQTIINAIKNLFPGLLPGASVRAGARALAPAAASVVLSVPAAAEAQPAVAVDAAPAAVAAAPRVHTPRAAAAARAVKAAAAEAESAAPQADPEQAAAPARSRASLRSAVADDNADNGSAPTRANRHSVRAN